MSQLKVWKSVARRSRNWKVILIALRHIERLEKKRASEIACVMR